MKTSKLEMKTKARSFIVSLAFLGIALSAGAQNYSISWYKIAGGGGTSTNGTYQVAGTVGQPDASGPMTGSAYSMTGGFWSLISVVQSSGMPTLYISGSGNTVTVSWQNVPGCTLQQNCDLTVPAGWGTCGYSCTTSNGTNYVNITNPTGSLYFRLRK
jgi:hypothetical protein